MIMNQHKKYIHLRSIQCMIVSIIINKCVFNIVNKNKFTIITKYLVVILTVYYYTILGLVSGMWH